MNIKEIAYKINDLGFENDYLFSKLQEIRFKHLDKKPRTWSPFAEYSIKDNYAFHSGGRKEIQFNIGEDFIHDKTIFRYGIAFSLEKSPSLKEPEKVFKEIIERYNLFLQKNLSFFNGFSFWYYQQHEFGEYFDSVKPIDDTLSQAGNFLFIGKYFEKNIAEITENEIKIILETFDYLIPAYEEIQFGQNSIRISLTCL